METKNLFQRIQDVSNEINNIEKNMDVGNGNYAYKAVRDIDVVLAVKKAETKNGIISIPMKQELLNHEMIHTTNSKGIESTSFADIVKMTVRIVNLDNTGEFIEVESLGRGLDSGDKGFGKASTYARKYALLNVYKIATGNDPDEEKSKALTVLKPNQIKDSVIGYLMSNYDYSQNVLSYFNATSVDDLTPDNIERIFKTLQQKGML